MLSPSSLPPDPRSRNIFPPKKMSDPFRPWVRPCACVGSGPKKIGRSVVAPEVPVGCHQPTPPPPTYRPPEMVTTINNGLVYQCLSMLDFRETCWTKKNDRRKSFKLSVVASWIKYMFKVVVKMIDLPQFPGWNNDPDLTWPNVWNENDIHPTFPGNG